MFKLAQSIVNKMDKGLDAFKKFQQTSNPAVNISKKVNTVTQATPVATTATATTKNSFGLTDGEAWLLDNIARVESGGKRNALGLPVNGDRAHGYFQFMGDSLKRYGYNKSTNDFLNNSADQVGMAKKFMYDLVRYSGNKINTQNPTVKDLQMLYAGWYSGPKAYKYLNNSAFMNKGQSASGVAMPSIAQAMNKIGKNTTKFNPNGYQPMYFK